MDHEQLTLLASARTDEELMERIDNRQKYMPETVEASLAELQQRGKHFTGEELQYIAEDMQARRRNAITSINRLSIFSSEFKHAIVKDQDAPAMYSRRVLYIFTVLTTPLFGSVMMAMNINKTRNKAGVWLVLLFGIMFTGLIIVVANNARPGSFGGVGIMGGLIASYILNYFFWNRYIGNGTFYRVKMAWGPLVVVIVIIGILSFALFMKDMQQAVARP